MFLVCIVTGKSYFIKGQLKGGSVNVMYHITCSKWLERYVGSAVNVKNRFRIYESDIKTKKKIRGSASHINKKYYHDTNPFQIFSRHMGIASKVLKTFYWAEKSTGIPSYLPY